MGKYIKLRLFLEIIFILANLCAFTWTANLETDMENGHRNNTIQSSLNYPTPSVLSLSEPLSRFTRSSHSMTSNYARQRCPGCDTFVKASQCMRRVWKYEQRELRCQPEPVWVKLEELHGPHYSIKPPVAKVNRCSGFCPVSLHTCLPTQTSFVKIPVILTRHLGHPDGPQSKCVEYEIEQHDSCLCGCEVKKEHCLNHHHKHEQCSCKCINEEMREKCLALAESQEKIMWNEVTCSCECEQRPCPSGQLWNTQSCRCKDIPEDIRENLLFAK